MEGFNNGGQMPAHGNEKSSSQYIMELQDKNAKLRLGLGKLLKICFNENMHQRDPYWAQQIGIAKQMFDETDPNK